MNKYWVLDNTLFINPDTEQIKSAQEKTQIIQNDFEDMVIETWNLNDSKLIDFSFVISEVDAIIPCKDNYYNPKYFLRQKHFEKYGITYTPQVMRRLLLPKKYFIEGEGIKNLSHWLY